LKYTYWNRASENLTGIKAEDAIGKTIFEVFPDTEETRKTAAVYQDVLKKKQAKSFEIEYRLEDQHRSFEINAYHAEDGIAVFVKNITEHKQIEQEHLAHLRFLESMDRVNRAIQGTNDLEQMMSDVLDVVLSVLDCDRASLVYPCDPEAATWQAPMERTKPEWPGALALGLEVPMDPEVARVFRVSRITNGPVVFGPGCKEPLPTEIAVQFNIQSQITMALYPKIDKPWNFVIHQCSHPRIWTQEERMLFREIGRRLADGLTSLLSFRSLQESEERYRTLVENLNDVLYTVDASGTITYLSPPIESVLGYAPADLVGKHFTHLVHPDDLGAIRQEFEYVLQNRIHPSEYRMRAKSGEYRWVSTSSRPIHEGERVIGLQGILIDITERKQVEEALAGGAVAHLERAFGRRPGDRAAADRARSARPGGPEHDRPGHQPERAAPAPGPGARDGASLPG